MRYVPNGFLKIKENKIHVFNQVPSTQCCLMAFEGLTKCSVSLLFSVVAPGHTVLLNTGKV